MHPDSISQWVGDSAGAEQARALIEELKVIDFPTKSVRAGGLSLAAKLDRRNLDPAVVMAAGVADSSYAFWNRLCKENNSATAVSGDREASLIDWWNIGLVVCDTIGAIIGTALCGPPCAIIFGAGASIIYILTTA